ncbi:MAG: hypothetical protein ACI36Z_03200 [Alloprevotella sp.]
MTQKEIEEFLADTKVYVNGKSREIQETDNGLKTVILGKHL